MRMHKGSSGLEFASVNEQSEDADFNGNTSDDTSTVAGGHGGLVSP